MGKSTVSVVLFLANSEVEVEVGTRNTLCEECDGEGKVNRFRHDAFTLSDFDGDVEDMHTFCEDNSRGLYDVVCPECKGKKVVKAPDLSELTPEQKVGYYAQQEREEYWRAEHASERRMGC